MDAPVRQPLAAAVGAIKVRAISLCSRINEDSKSPNLPSERRISRSLVTELRLYGGALFTLETLAIELEPVASQPADAAAFSSDSFILLRQLGEVLDSFEEKVAESSDERSILRATARRYRNRITYVLASTQTYADLALLLSTGIQHRDEKPEAEAKDLSKWLTTLNAPYHNHRPREEYLQKQFVAGRLVEFPGYTEAAMSWPRFAEEHWSTIQDQVKTLFVVPRSYNFVQWVLEYARETRLDRLEADAFLALTNSLRDGSAGPLHLAAAFGLPSLVESLLAGGADVNQDGGWLGSPLFSALVGPVVLTKGSSPESMDDFYCHGVSPLARRAVIKKLLDAGADGSYRLKGPTGEVCSLAALAFWFSCIVNDHTIFEKIALGGADLDAELDRMLVGETDLVKRAKPAPSTLALLITCVLDSLLTCRVGIPWYGSNSGTSGSIEQFMEEHSLVFTDGPGPSRLLKIMSEPYLRRFVASTVLEDECLFFSRLAMHPRFDPNQLAQQQDKGTIAHIAVGCDEFDILDVLFKAGADFTLRDDQGRTPLMLSESERMVERLIQHGVSTTATDNKGRNIWYYAAATNDEDLMSALIKRDPCGKQNMATASTRGTTPLDKALRYTKQLAKVPSSFGTRRPPRAARLLLQHGAKCANTGPHPAFLMGVEWGCADLAKSLVDAGADPRATDDTGENALHKLNMGATPDLVSYVQEVCKGMPLATGPPTSNGACKSDQGKKRKRASTGLHAVLTPAETIFTNMATVNARGYPEPSCHPSCPGELSNDVYKLLLTPEQLAFHDNEGLGLWARFCKLVVPRWEDAGDGDFSSYMQSVGIAIGCLIDAGALTRYETEANRAAVLLLADFSGHICWPLTRLPYVYAVLRHHRSSDTLCFLRSGTGSALLDMARGNLAVLADLMEQLIESGSESGSD